MIVQNESLKKPEAISRHKVLKAFQSATDYWESVGIPQRGEVLYKSLHEGVPVKVYNNLANLSGMARSELSRAVKIPQSTLKRRLSTGRFNQNESDRLYRFAELLKAATDLFEGDPGKARDWMFKPAKGLGKRKPIEMLATSAETEGVLDYIGRLEHGVVS